MVTKVKQDMLDLAYDTVVDMVAAAPVIGAKFTTKGYYTAGDGAGATYLITAGNTGDGWGDHNIGANTATLQIQNLLDVKHYGVRMDGVTDDTTALQAFFDIVLAKEINSFKWNGTCVISAPIEISSNHVLRYIEGFLHIKATSGMVADSMFTITDCAYLNWNGTLQLTGNGNTSPGDRGIRDGLVLQNSGRMNLDYTYVDNFWRYGINTGSFGVNNSLSSFGNIVARDCGTRTGDDTHADAIPFTFTNRVDTGGSNSTGQLSTITVDHLDRGVELEGDCYINGVLYSIEAIDVAASTISVFPWIDLTLPTGTGCYIYGAALFTDGKDSGIMTINSIDAQRCGRAYFTNALYGATLGRVVAQSCFGGVQYMNRLRGAFITDTIDIVYFEGNWIDIFIKGFQNDTGLSIGGVSGALDWDKITRAKARSTSNLLNDSSMDGLAIQDARFKRFSVQLPNNAASSTPTLDWQNQPYGIVQAYRTRNSAGLPMKVKFNAELNVKFGYTIHQVKTFRTSTTHGDITITADDADWTMLKTGTISQVITVPAAIFSVEVSIFASIRDKAWFVSWNFMES